MERIACSPLGLWLDLPLKVRELLRSVELKLSDESIDLLASALEFDPGEKAKCSGRFWCADYQRSTEKLEPPLDIGNIY